MHVTEETAKGGVPRKIPVTCQVFDVPMVYREAFGLSAFRRLLDAAPLLLSPRTLRNATMSRGVP